MELIKIDSLKYILVFWVWKIGWKGKEWVKERIGICRKNDRYMKGIFARASSTSFLLFILFDFVCWQWRTKIP